jgi:disulfide bond formation protein DsbB
LSVVLLVAALRHDRLVRWYAIPLATIGALVSTYHYVIEWRPSLEGGACGVGPDSCTTIWFREFGFVTLALMALCGFVAIIALLAGREPRDRRDRPEDRPVTGDLERRHATTEHE